ncbi:MAG: PD-(D/E)XK nuclease family protein [Defluviicoccus sp.]|nr:PD-(D/E)XK nuclease family protein [Defluviicoccus sp.]MDE0278713.1 PD-(D/E)XK nuclease family protein [Defluviicoccus sp.]
MAESEAGRRRDSRGLDRGFAFDPADLRLIADYRSDPLTRATRNNLLGFRSPAWSDETRQALAWVGESWSDAVSVAIRKGSLRFVEPPQWPRGVSAVESAFALSRRRHLFRAEPSVTWATFTEPQLTKGFAHFLDADDQTARTERVRALLKALGAAQFIDDIGEVTVTAEAAISGNKRIDLLIEWRDSSRQNYAVAIEVKLGHHVTTGQLSAYRTHLRKIPNERRRLVVVSPRLTGRTDRSLQRNRDWRWIAWHDLLVAHERSLDDEHDSVEYHQFRRTLWDQTG